MVPAAEQTSSPAKEALLATVAPRQVGAVPRALIAVRDARAVSARVVEPVSRLVVLLRRRRLPEQRSAPMARVRARTNSRARAVHSEIVARSMGGVEARQAIVGLGVTRASVHALEREVCGRGDWYRVNSCL
jgi:hypothetical protein